MKWILVVVMCSGWQNMCLDPYVFKDKYDDVYSCMIDGYTKAIEKTEELGRKEVNAHKIYIKFDCYEDSTYKTPTSNQPIEEKVSSTYIR